MRRAVGWFWKALVLLACVGYQFLVHSALSHGEAEPVRLALTWLPLVVLAIWVIVRSKNKPLWAIILAVAGLATYVLQDLEQLGLAAAYGIPHAAAYLFLLWFFGHTLIRGREALITRLARRVHGRLPPEMEAYTRRVTLSWCVFFAAQVVISGVLFAFAPLHIWSLFINLLNFPLLALMFVGEYLYRVTRYRDYPHVSIAKAIQVFASDASLPRSAEAG